MKKTKKIIAIILISMLIMLANSVTFAVSTSWSYDSSSSTGTSSSTSKTSKGNITTAWKNVNTGSPELIKNFDGEEYHIYYSRQSDGTWKATSITLPSGVTVTSSQANFKSEISKVASETLQSIPGRDTDTGSSTSSTSGTGISTIGTGQITQDSGMNKMISTIFGIVQYICIAAAVIVMLITGVRYMIVAPDQKAEIKKQSIALVVGAVIIFSISTILKIIADITSATIK